MIVSPLDAEPIASWIVENVPGTFKVVALATLEHARRAAVAAVALDSHPDATALLGRTGDCERGRPLLGLMNAIVELHG